MTLGSLLDSLEQIAPRLEYYPGWSKAIFLTTFVLVLVSIVVYAALYPSVARREDTADE
jgi:hypothetical protein